MNKNEKSMSVGQATPLALQHVVAMVVGVVTVPTVLGHAAGLDSGDLLIMMQASLLCAGIAILIQAFGKFNIGSNLPVIIGSGFAFMPTLISIASKQGIPAVFGAQIVGSIVGIAVGIGFKKIRFLFPPVVTSSIIIVVGISLYKTAVDYMAGGYANQELYGSMKAWGVALVTLVAVLIFQNFGKGAVKISATLLGLLVGYFVALAVGLVHFDNVGTASIVAVPKILPFGMQFDVGAITALSIVFIVNAIQDIGQFEATAMGAFEREATASEISGGVIGNNVASIIGACIGGVPVATAGQNVGIVSQTKATDKKIFAIAAGIIIALAISPKLTALFITIPLPVLGGATIGVFANMAMTGIRMLSNAGLTQRNVTIAGLSIALAVGVASVNLKEIKAFAQCPEIIQQLFGGSELVIVAIVAIVLNLVLPKEKK